MNSQNNREMIDSIPWKYQRGNRNAITDVQHIKVGHLTVSKDLLDRSGKKIMIRTGLTAVFPADMRKEERFFTGFLQSRGINDISGYAVVEDFQYLNSPIVLSNIHNFGAVYNAILSYGFNLGRSEIWPPIVVSLDDSSLDGSKESSVTESDVLKLLASASSGSVAEGSVGIGTGLQTFGWKGGIGSSSRTFTVDERLFTVGALVAANFGNGQGLAERIAGADLENRAPHETGSLAMILGTDVPLLPYQIKRIVFDTVLSLPLATVANRDKDSLICLLFSVANAMSMKDEGPRLFRYTLSSDAVLKQAADAASESVKEAILRSICLSKPLDGIWGEKVRAMPGSLFRAILENFKKSV